MKEILLLLLLLCTIGGRAQTIDSVYVDTTASPNTCFLRLEFPTPFYQITRVDHHVHPALGISQSYLAVYVRECTNLNNSLVVDTVCPLLPVSDRFPHTMWIYLALDTNTSDSLCAIAADTVRLDSATWSEDPLFLGENEIKAVGVPEIFPNPARSWLSIKGGHNLTGLRLYSADGRLAMAVAMPGERIDVRHLSAGSYIAVLETSQAIIRQRVFIHP